MFSIFRDYVAPTGPDMSGAAFILVINLAVAGLFCAAFVAIALYDRYYQSARWFGLAYGFGIFYLLFEASLPILEDARVAALLGYGCFAATLVFLNVGLARRYDVVPPRTLLAAAFGIALLVGAVTQEMPRDSVFRMFLYQAPYCLLQAVGVSIVMRARSRRMIDNMLAVFLAIGSLHYFAKPFLAMSFGGTGISAQQYLGTNYAMFSQALGAVTAIATALLLIFMLAADILRQVTAKSETDALSGLLNRRGFEERLAHAAHQRGANGLPVSLVIADLDHFKQVNDSFGHAVGDRLIVRFAETLRQSASEHHRLGRIGGEEFAIVLPGSNLAAGRLFAESVRAAYAAIDGEGLPPDTRFTASFGVAEMAPGEIPASLVARADAALYEAKRAGRDCVRVSRVEQVIDDGSATLGRSVPSA